MKRVAAMLALVACGASEERTTTPTPLTQADLKPDPQGGPPLIVSAGLESYRTSGSKNVVPDGDVMAAAAKTGQRLVGSFKFCIDVSGRVTDVKIVQTTQVESYDAKIIGKIKRWTYKPVLVDGAPTAVCSAVTFVFTASS